MNLKTLLPHFRAGLIEREALQTQLSKALAQSRLVLLVAPAGFGKTALLSSELRRQAAHRAVAWVTLDEDDDVQRLLGHLAEALEPYDPPWRIAPEALVRQASAAAELPQIARTLLATLAATEVEHGVLALDDLHAVTDARVFELLNALLEGLPPNWSLAIASRSQPALSLARLRASREIAEFGLEALSFNVEEVRMLLQKAEATDDSETARLMHEQTNGWAAGLCLAIDAKRAGDAPASVGLRRSRSHLFAYLASEVFEQMPTALQNFLLRCSVLTELSPTRCAAVSSAQDTEQLLAEIERRGLFVWQLEGEELTLRMHDLFRDFLEDQLRRRDPDALPVLLRRAAAFEADPVRKVQLLIRAGAWDDAEQALCAAAPRLLVMGEHAQLERLLDEFARDRAERSPFLSYARGLLAWHHFVDAEVQRSMHRAAEEFERIGRFLEARHARGVHALSLLFNGQVDEARAMFGALAAPSSDVLSQVLDEMFAYLDTGYHGPALGPARHFDHVVDLLGAEASPALWYFCTARIYTFVSRAGMRPVLERFVQGALAAAGTGDYSPLRTSAMVLNGWVKLWYGHAAEALAQLEGLQADSRWLGHPAALRLPLAHLGAACHAIRGDRQRMEEILQGMLPANFHLTPPALRLRIWNLVFAMRALANDWAGALVALDTMEGLNAQVHAAHLEPLFKSWRAIRALREGRLDEARDALRPMVARYAEIDRFGLEASSRIVLAVIELRHGDRAAAWQALEPLVERIATSGESVDLVVLGGSELRELADASLGAAAPTEGVAALHRWLDFSSRMRAATKPEAPATALRDLSFSAREMQVLERLAQGDSNKLIARALDLSPHTVKRHVARILDRLALASRGEAAAWYRVNVHPLQDASPSR